MLLNISQGMEQKILEKMVLCFQEDHEGGHESENLNIHLCYISEARLFITIQSRTD